MSTESQPSTIIKLSSGVKIDTTAKKHQGTLTRVIWKGKGDFKIVKIGGVTCLGVIHEIAQGALYTLEGQFTENPRYQDWNFKFSSYSADINEKHGMLEYLSREAHGIGPKIAAELIKAYKDNVIRNLANSPASVCQDIKGISYEKSLELQTWANGELSNREVKEKLYQIGLKPAQVAKLIKTYGSNAEAQIKKDCFKLVEVAGFGFKTVSAIADMIGVPASDPGRIKAALLFAFNQMQDEGHTCVTKADLIREACALLQLKQTTVLPCIDELVNDGHLIDESMTLERYNAINGLSIP